VSPGRLALDLRTASGVAGDVGTDVRLFPNPTDDRLQVSWEAPVERGEVVVHDTAGREVLRQRVGPGDTRLMLNVQDLPAGPYLLQLNERPAQRFTKR
ncbi:MAG: T9SS type A sorting domain-containing protein, partial [Flavobacteriales bacterium]|nr:T9SS type A sorting domain-containing protein [Flavobacteriales bacterium]